MLLRKNTSNIMELLDAGGNLLFSFTCQASGQVVSENRVICSDASGQKFSLYADKITDTQLLPAGLVPFSGDGKDLLSLMNTNFFAG